MTVVEAGEEEGPAAVDGLQLGLGMLSQILLRAGVGADKGEKVADDDSGLCGGLLRVHGGDVGVFNPKRHKTNTSIR